MELRHPAIVDLLTTDAGGGGRAVAAELMAMQALRREEQPESADAQSPLEEATVASLRNSVDARKVALRALVAEAAGRDDSDIPGMTLELWKLARSFERVPWTAAQRAKRERDELERQERYAARQRGEDVERPDVVAAMFAAKEPMADDARRAWRLAVDRAATWVLDGSPIDDAPWNEVLERNTLHKLAMAQVASAGGEQGRAVEKADEMRAAANAFHDAALRWLAAQDSATAR